MKIVTHLLVCTVFCFFLTAFDSAAQGPATSGKWRTTFGYEDPQLQAVGIAESARTVDETEKLRAQAKLLDLITSQGGQLEGVLVEETHFGPNGNVQFQCKSRFNFPLGQKVGETDKRGSKTAEYYFKWPVLRGF